VIVAGFMARNDGERATADGPAAIGETAPAPDAPSPAPPTATAPAAPATVRLALLTVPPRAAVIDADTGDVLGVPAAAVSR
jgi:hypothetical protein